MGSQADGIQTGSAYEQSNTYKVSGKVVAKGQILDHVWDYDFAGESTVVETYISSLRKKLDFGRPRLIQTVRGIGYRMTPP